MGDTRFDGMASAIMLMHRSGSAKWAGDGRRGSMILNGCNIC